MSKVPAFLWQQSEDELQAAVIEALRYAFPKFEIVAVPNGGYRDPREAAKLKRTGVVAGIPDIIVAMHTGRVCWIEMKTSTGRLSEKQREIHERLATLGHAVCVCRDVHEAVAFVRECAA